MTVNDLIELLMQQNGLAEARVGGLYGRDSHAVVEPLVIGVAKVWDLERGSHERAAVIIEWDY